MSIPPELPTQPTPGSPNQPTSLEEGEVWIEYHPASGKQAEILRADHFLGPSVIPTDFLHNPDIPPWHPFRSRADFEQTELFLNNDCSDPFIDSQLKIIHSGSPSKNHVTLQSAKDMHRTLARIPQIEGLPGVCTLSLASPVLNLDTTSSLRQWDLMYHILTRLIARTQYASETYSLQCSMLLRTTYSETDSCYIRNADTFHTPMVV